MEFWPCFRRKQKFLEAESDKILTNSLDIRNLIKEGLINKLAFKFILQEHELRYIKLLGKSKRQLKELKDKKFAAETQVTEA